MGNGTVLILNLQRDWSMLWWPSLPLRHGKKDLSIAVH